MIIYPAIDILNGLCVRLTKGMYDHPIQYNDDPVDVAYQIMEKGLTHVHIVDLNAAKGLEVNNRSLVNRIIKETNLKVQLGGGIRTEEDVQKWLEVGVERCIVGSAAVQSPHALSMWIKKYGPESIVVGADFLDGNIKINGWVDDAGLTLPIFIEKMSNLGAENFLCTDISRDGLLQGSAVETYDLLLKTYPSLFFIASGGIVSLAELHIFRQLGLSAAVIGKAWYEDFVTLDELKKFTLDGL